MTADQPSPPCIFRCTQIDHRIICGGVAFSCPCYTATLSHYRTAALSHCQAEGGAALNSISYSMLLPITTLSNALPALGPYREQIQAPTIIGLLVVLSGFFAYEVSARFYAASCGTSLQLPPCAVASMCGDVLEGASQPHWCGALLLAAICSAIIWWPPVGAAMLRPLQWSPRLRWSISEEPKLPSQGRQPVS